MSNEIELVAYDRIDGDMARSVIDALQTNKAAKTITVNVNSPGGSVFDAVAIYNALTRHPGRVVVNIDGMALSSALIVSMAGDQIRMAANAMIMLHDPTINITGTSEELQAEAGLLTKTREMIVATFAVRTKLTAERVRELMADETWFSAEEAVANGFADEIVPAKRLAAFAELAAFENVPKDWLAAVLAEQQQDSGVGGQTPQSLATKETKTMTAEVKDVDVAELRSEGVKAEQGRFAELDKAFDDKAFVAEMYKANKTADDARPVWHEREATRLTAQNDGLQTANADLRGQLEAATAEVEKLKAENTKIIEDACGEPLSQPAGGSDPQDRAGVIKAARDALVKEREDKAVVCSEASWINSALHDAEMKRLGEQEIEELRIKTD